MGHNTLSQTVRRLCKQAVAGFKMNHLLRVTSAMRLFQSGVDKQLIIMSHTGHRSVDGVRSYKRISEEQKKKVSGILSSVST